MRILLVILLMSTNCLFAQVAGSVDINYNDIVLSKMFDIHDVRLTDSLDIRYISIGYYAENVGKGCGYLIVLPKDTIFAKICNTKKYNRREWKLRNEIIQHQMQKMVEIAISSEVEQFFDIFFFYTRQEFLYENGSVVDDYGSVIPDYSFRDNTPIEEFQLKDGKWLLSRVIPDRENRTDLDFGVEKAEEVLKARFGKMAEEMEKINDATSHHTAKSQ